ncbi:hypothetical protein BD310DRAFT_940603 [Dichomitus squalens]|uniref:Uncharacterized protein n=1 Tax=Dichomitus squalens TaxID=114155 RepID=A0A4Q9PGJ9_9APHY|nr:hypothetical protein BD310DRAFT_940603 [Dichomitus squalens]
MPRSNEADRAVQAASVASLLTCGTSFGTPCSSSTVSPPQLLPYPPPYVFQHRLGYCETA